MNDSTVQASTQKLLDLLEELAAFSTAGPGVTRLLYTEEWSRAQIFLQEKMAGLGLEVSVDKVGNVYGRLSGRDPQQKVILTGSHIDTVVNGGKYDGAYGIAAAMIALQDLQRNFGQPQRTLEVVSFCEEEGSRFPLAYWGSGHVTERYDGSEAETCMDAEGVTLKAAMAQSSFLQDITEEKASKRTGVRNDIGAFVELHIEQGIILEKTDTQIGVVQGIVGQRRYVVKVSGIANHAGTTPMFMRQDALASAVEMLYVLESSAKTAGEPLVATSGKLEVNPNTPNVIPGEVLFTLDIRHSEEDELERFCEKLLAECNEIAVKRGVTLEATSVLHTVPAPMDMKLSAMLENICRLQGKTYRTMVSGAGHDAQLLAPRCPTAMIFVPSRAGISHSPEEYTSPEQLAAGLEVLTAMLYELAY
ncbi:MULTISPECIES: Zn-dependent hydrolase [Paenibacillus]|uniref:Allantoate amidohydrolase n=1 Tax=Paenibacillus odorifer TaxID=189426 RepID=A0A1R0X9G3_9BACL|nr:MULTISPECIES: Zn-dependent hydrolase [Paenibacillus]ETT62864.1 allantoate amidohydrolase [Paenibacillus sp. FSL H8-237]OMD31407.1 allantoate amidohydrolase [Paenibacillus odorifer]OME20266.1 allantoate amidohydrolase [Paenibacillus odorifer]OME35739.1 allantoate amidohydrolase [Paenibacillus odorifer]OME40173.1 allantoate amidohydrolase [Paenibacillus odorifer]